MAQNQESSAQSQADLHFGPFRLEKAKRLWCADQFVNVRPRSLAVLRYLAERSNLMVTSDELFSQLWPGIYVTKTVLRVCISELRQALQDNATTPQFIETVGRQGYRFLVPVTTTASSSASVRVDVPLPKAERAPSPQAPTHFVGRGQELERLQAAVARARQGKRQTVFVSGEPGIGKTALVDHFLAQLRIPTTLFIAHGQCIERHGSSEAYLPLLEAVGQLCHSSQGEPVREALRRYAPLWLAQFPALLTAEERDALLRQTYSNGREQMLRQWAEALEAVTAEALLVLVVEDLQWSDPSTLAALTYLSRRRAAAQLLILGTYRPVDVMVSRHPLRGMIQDLLGQQQCEELGLELLTLEEVADYLRCRLGDRQDLDTLSEELYRRSEGNALFLANFVDAGSWAADGESQAAVPVLLSLPPQIPVTLRQMVMRQAESLPVAEQELLYVASVGGQEFTVAEVAGVSGRSVEEVEEVFNTLARRERLIQEIGLSEWREEIVTERYTFRHALYQQVVYEQLGQGRRMRLHRQLGQWKEEQYGTKAALIAEELAVHFTEGRDYHKAVRYHSQAGETALRRSAYREANDHCKRGLDLLERLPDAPERQQQELALRMVLSVALAPTQGYLAEEVIENLSRARRLCQVLKDDAVLVSVLINLGRAHDMRSDRAAIEQIAVEERGLLDRVQEPALALQLHAHLGTSSFWCGALAQAQGHHARVLELYDPRQHRELFLHFSYDPAVTAGVVSSCSLWLAGWPDQACSRLQRSLSWAKELGHSFSLVYGLMMGAIVRLCCGDLDDAERLAAEGEKVAHEYGAALLRVIGGILQAHIEVQREKAEVGLSVLTEGLSQYRGMGARYLVPLFLCFVAEAYRQMGRVEEGLATIAEAVHLTETWADLFWAAEVHRLEGELTLAKSRVQSLESRVKKSPRSKVQSPKSAKTKSQILNSKSQEEAEACFLKAIAIAQQQGAKSLELRAAMSLARLWQQQGKKIEAHKLLSDIYNWFTEGFDTKDLREAKILLDELS